MLVDHFTYSIGVGKHTAVFPKNPRSSTFSCRGRHVETTATTPKERRVAKEHSPAFRLKRNTQLASLKEEWFLLGESSVKFAWRLPPLLLLSVHLCSERWMAAAEDAPSVFQMEGAKEGLSNKGIAERLTLGIIRILGMYSV